MPRFGDFVLRSRPGSNGADSLRLFANYHLGTHASVRGA
jgi:hypothetical protein